MHVQTPGAHVPLGEKMRALPRTLLFIRPRSCLSCAKCNNSDQVSSTFLGSSNPAGSSWWLHWPGASDACADRFSASFVTVTMRATWGGTSKSLLHRLLLLLSQAAGILPRPAALTAVGPITHLLHDQTAPFPYQRCPSLSVFKFSADDRCLHVVHSHPAGPSCIHVSRCMPAAAQGLHMCICTWARSVQSCPPLGNCRGRAFERINRLMIKAADTSLIDKCNSLP